MIKKDAGAYETSRGLLQTLNQHLSFTKFQNERIQASDAADGEAAMLLQVNQQGQISMRRVTIGTSDSGGSGFRVLRIAND
jgi:hypothetical protein